MKPKMPQRIVRGFDSRHITTGPMIAKDRRWVYKKGNKIPPPWRFAKKDNHKMVSSHNHRHDFFLDCKPSKIQPSNIKRMAKKLAYKLANRGIYCKHSNMDKDWETMQDNDLKWDCLRINGDDFTNLHAMFVRWLDLPVHSHWNWRTRIEVLSWLVWRV